MTFRKSIYDLYPNDFLKFNEIVCGLEFYRNMATYNDNDVGKIIKTNMIKCKVIEVKTRFEDDQCITNVIYTFERNEKIETRETELYSLDTIANGLGRSNINPNSIAVGISGNHFTFYKVEAYDK